VRHGRLAGLTCKAIIEEGVDCSILNTISFWDGLIVASAAAAKCAELLSEDRTDSQVIQGIAVRNPFGRA